LNRDERPDLTRLTISVAQHLYLTGRFPPAAHATRPHVEGVDHAGALSAPLWPQWSKGYEDCSVKSTPKPITDLPGIAVVSKTRNCSHVRCAAIESALKGENRHGNVLIVVMELISDHMSIVS
jgi:hypothetical protein